MKTLAHISDLHFGRIDPAACDALLDDVGTLHPALTVVSGDLTQRARIHEFRAASEFLQRLPGAWLAVPGNHDIPLFNPMARVFRPMARWRRWISRDLNPVWMDDEITVLGVNTARRMTIERGKISDAQIARIRDRLHHEPADGQRFRVLVTHHPFVPGHGAPSRRLVQKRELAIPALETWGADLLLAGHLHHAWHGDVRAHHVQVRSSILVAQAATAISTRHRGHSNGYNVVKIDGRRVEIEMRDFDGRCFQAVQRVVYQHRGGEWRPLESWGLVTSSALAASP